MNINVWEQPLQSWTLKANLILKKHRTHVGIQVWVQQKAGDSSHRTCESHAQCRSESHSSLWKPQAVLDSKVCVLMMFTAHLLWALPPSKDLSKSRRIFNTQHQPFYRSLFRLVLIPIFSCCNNYTAINRTWFPQHLWEFTKSRNLSSLYPFSGSHHLCSEDSHTNNEASLCSLKLL